jgi:hypothetical protein
MIDKQVLFSHPSKLTMKFFKRILPVLLILFMGLPTIAQPVDPCVDPFEYCPIDDNVYFLIIAVVLIAGYKYIAAYRNRVVIK